MTTTYDHSFGADSVIKSMDAFCPLTPRFDPKLAARRARPASKCGGTSAADPIIRTPTCSSSIRRSMAAC